MNENVLWYISFFILELLLIWTHILSRQAELLGVPTIIYNYNCVIISVRVIQLLFCIDVTKSSLLILKEDITTYLDMNKQGLVSLNSLKHKLRQLKQTYEDIQDLSYFINDCGRVSLLIYSMDCVVFLIYVLYYGFLSIIKDIPLISGARKNYER